MPNTKQEFPGQETKTIQVEVPLYCKLHQYHVEALWHFQEECDGDFMSAANALTKLMMQADTRYMKRDEKAAIALLHQFITELYLKDIIISEINRG